MKLRFLLLLLAFLCIQQGFTQRRFDNWWKDVEQYEMEGRAKSAFEKAQKILKKADRKENPKQYVKAFLYVQKYKLLLQENPKMDVVENFKTAINQEKGATKAILASYFAESLQDYYQQNRYKINKRTNTNTTAKSMAEWDKQQFEKEITHYYEVSIADKELLFNQALQEYTDILEYGANFNRFESTLFDLLANRYCDYLKSHENYSNKQLFLTDKKWFAPLDEFVKRPLSTADLQSPVGKVLQIYQQLISLHEHDELSKNLINLKRLTYVKDRSTLKNAETIYLEQLKNQLTQTTDAKSIDWIHFYIAHYYVKHADKKKQPTYHQKALQHIDSIFTAIDHTYAEEKALELAKSIKRKHYTLESKTYVAPQQAFLIQTDFRNVDSLYIKTYKVPRKTKEKWNWRKSLTKSQRDSLVRKFLLNQTAFREEAVPLPSKNDYFSYTTEILQEGLPVGYYLMVASPIDEDSLTIMDYHWLQATNLDYTRFNKNTTQDLLVTQRHSGKPLAGVKVQLEGNPQKTTDTDGRVSFSGHPTDYQRDLLLIYQNDTLSSSFRFSEKRKAYLPDPIIKTSIFTDRSIYRPGQSVYFKGIFAYQTMQKEQLVTDETFKVVLYDANRNKVDSLSLTTNDFGSIHGAFKLPQNGLNGRFSIKIQEDFKENTPYSKAEVDYAYTTIQVEEYKRPRFEVHINEIDATYVLNDSIAISGSAEAFFGGKITDAEVRYTVDRSLRYNREFVNSTRYHSIESTRLLSDTTKTDGNGDFHIHFKATPDLSIDKAFLPVFSYKITASVTDINGETRESTRHIKVGYHTKTINLALENVQDTIPQLAIHAKDLNGRTQTVKGWLSIHQYQIPQQALISDARSWSIPEIQSIPKKRFTEAFPYYAYDSLAVAAYWPSTKIDSFWVDTQSKKSFSIDSLLPKDGKYQFRLHPDEANIKPAHQEYTQNKHNNLLLPEDRILSVKHTAEANQNKAQVQLTFSTELPDLSIFLEFNDQQKIHEHVINLSKGTTRKSFRFPLTESPIEYRVTYNLHNTQHSLDQQINIPTPPQKEEKIVFEVLRFRDKLEPGKPETWKLKIKNQDKKAVHAEVLASMYDASLDEFRPHNWQEELLYPYFTFKRAAFNTTALSLPNANHFRNYSNNFKKNNASAYASLYRYRNISLTNHFGQFKHFGYDFANANRSQDAYLKKLIAKANTKQSGISGHVTDAEGLPLPGVTVMIAGTNKGTQTDFEGNFSIMAAKGEELVFSYVGFEDRHVKKLQENHLSIEMSLDNNTLNEVVSESPHILDDDYSDFNYYRGNVYKKQKSTQASTSLTIQALQGQVPGLSIESNSGQPGGDTVVLRGVGSINGNAEPIFVVDGEIINEDEFRELSKNDILSVTVLKGAEATAAYGNRAAEGAIVITTRKGAKAQLAKVETRTNLKETAFFFPQLQTDEKGEISFNFDSPEALTRWKFQAFAHDKNLNQAKLNLNTVTQKTLNIIPNFPRFFRSKDTVYISAKINNLSEQKLDAIVQLSFTDELQQKPANLIVAEPIKNSSIEAKGNSLVQWKLVIPEQLTAVRYRIVAKAGNFADGEENILPVLSNRSFLTEALPIWVDAKSEEKFQFDALKGNASQTLTHHRLVFEYTTNPAWTVLKSLPYLIEFPHECAEQTMARFYANQVSHLLIKSNPAIAQQLNQWKNFSQKLSDLSKNEDLKSILLQETPWIKTAQTQEEQLKNLADLLSEQHMRQEAQKNLQQLANLQYPSGGFPWFKGGKESISISTHILVSMEHLQQLDTSLTQHQDFQQIKQKLISYLDDYYHVYSLKTPERKQLDRNLLSYLYARSFTDKKTPHVHQLTDEFLTKFSKKWITWTLEEKLQFALIAARFEKNQLASNILISLQETAVIDNDYGMYWKNTQPLWLASPIEDQALAIEAFAEIKQDKKTIEQLKKWLLRNKKTEAWQSTKATTKAIYALLTKGENWLVDNQAQTQVKIGEKAIDLNQAKEQSGYVQVSYTPEEINPQKANIHVQNKSNSPQYGAMYWQYFEDNDQVNAAQQASLQLKKRLFKVIESNTGTTGQPIEEAELKLGDKIRVQLTLTATENFSFMHLKDLRAAGLEPISVISSHKRQDGLNYYQSTKDAATHFFFDRLPKGTYLIEYDLRINNPGNFSQGFAELESMYAPEFRVQSDGTRLSVKP